MKSLVALLMGIAMGRVIWLFMRTWFAQAALRRTNLRGKNVATAVGLVAVLTVVVVEALRVVMTVLVARDDAPTTSLRLAMLCAVLGFGLLGFVDDIFGHSSTAVDDAVARGFRGHLNEARHSRLTTGALKLLGGAALAIPLAAIVAPSRGLWIILDAAVIALFANMINLFDRAPLRAIKVSVVFAGIVMLVTRRETIGIALAPVMGAALSLIPQDAKERGMIGDTGANALGGAVGVALIAGSSNSAVSLWLAFLLLLTLISEAVSFSAIIAKFPPLRVLDSIGRLR